MSRREPSRDLLAFLVGTGLGAALVRAWRLREEGARASGMQAAAGGGEGAVTASVERLHGLLGEIHGLLGQKAGRKARAAGLPQTGAAVAEATTEVAAKAAPRGPSDAWRTPDQWSYGNVQNTSERARLALMALMAMMALPAGAVAVGLAASARKPGARGLDWHAGPAAAGFAAAAAAMAAWKAWRPGKIPPVRLRGDRAAGRDPGGRPARRP